MTGAPRMTRVVIESPFQACPKNLEYALRCLADSLRRGEAPYASHLLYPQLLDDTVPDQRRLGMHAGFAWGEQAEVCAVYVDRGFTSGMAEGLRRAMRPRRMHEARPRVAFRSLGEGPYEGAAVVVAWRFVRDAGEAHLADGMQLFAECPLAAGERRPFAVEAFAFDRLAETGQTARVALRSAEGHAVAVGEPHGRARLELGPGPVADLFAGAGADDLVVLLFRPG